MPVVQQPDVVTVLLCEVLHKVHGDRVVGEDGAAHAQSVKTEQWTFRTPVVTCQCDRDVVRCDDRMDLKVKGRVF